MRPPLTTTDRLDRLRGLSASAEARLTLDLVADRAVVTSVSAWSAVMHFDHVASASRSILGAVERILANDNACIPGGETSPRATLILAAGRIPRGVAEAPTAMRPAESPVPGEVATRLGDLRKHLEALAGRASEIDAATHRIPHFALGPMTASQWIAFALIHFEHHVEIAGESAPPTVSTSRPAT